MVSVNFNRADSFASVAMVPHGATGPQLSAGAGRAPGPRSGTRAPRLGTAQRDPLCLRASMSMEIIDFLFIFDEKSTIFMKLDQNPLILIGAGRAREPRRSTRAPRLGAAPRTKTYLKKKLPSVKRLFQHRTRYSTQRNYGMRVTQHAKKKTAESVLQCC